MQCTVRHRRLSTPAIFAATVLAALATVSCASRMSDDATDQALARKTDASASPRSMPVAPGGGHTCAVARKGVRCWGFNASGQLNAPALRHVVQVGAGNAFSCALHESGVTCWGSNSSMQSTVPPLSHPRQLSVGRAHACALDDSGIRCWGDNTAMQSAVPGDLREPIAVAAGGSHTCALDADGVKCWGRNTSGQTTVPPLRHPTVVAAGDGHSCAIDDDGVHCWGSNTSAQIVVPPLRKPTQVVGGGSHTCALDADGVHCWGENFAGQTRVPSLRRPTFIAAGRAHTCAVDDDEIRCWGSNTSDQATLPADFELFGRHACAIASDGLRCVGENEHGQLGIGSEDDRVIALAGAPVTDLGRTFGVAVDVAIGAGFACARSTSGAVKCWGKNTRGQLGIADGRDRGVRPGEMGEALPAVPFGDAGAITKIDVGDEHSCALDDRGEVFCWGKGSSGQLGTESGDDRGPVRPRLKAGSVVRDVALGRSHTCVLTDEGVVYCFGANDAGQLGIGNTDAVGDRPGTMGDAMQPVLLGDDFRAKAIASGDRHVCALSQDGRVKCWGAADTGQLGLGDTNPRGASAEGMGAALPAVDLGHGQFVVGISCGSRHCCARLIQNTMKCWGDNSFGQLGLGDVTMRGGDPATTGDNLPFVMTGAGERVSSIRLDGNRTCARADSGLRCWGQNGGGELGYGDQTPRGGSFTTIPRLLLPLGI